MFRFCWGVRAKVRPWTSCAMLIFVDDMMSDVKQLSIKGELLGAGSTNTHRFIHGSITY